MLALFTFSTQAFNHSPLAWFVTATCLFFGLCVVAWFFVALFRAQKLSVTWNGLNYESKAEKPKTGSRPSKSTK
jgi:hypothetical protein